MFSPQTLFVTINIDEEDHDRILEFFGMKKDDVPTFRAIKLEDEMSKFKPESKDLSEETIRKFVEDFVAGTLKVNVEKWDKYSRFCRFEILFAVNFSATLFVARIAGRLGLEACESVGRQQFRKHRKRPY